MFIQPMLLQKTDLPFDDDDYITELKLDGIRLIWSKFNNKVRIYTRHNNEVTALFPELTTLDLPNGIILDGELVSPDRDGKPDFEAIMKRFLSKKSTVPIQYCVFDIIYYENKNVTSLLLPDRKEIVTKLIPQDSLVICNTRWIYGNGIDYYNAVKENQLEGIVLKKAHTKYEPGKRSYSWLKVINYQHEDIYITGLRKDKFGLLLSFLDGKSAGLMEFMSANIRKQFYSKYKTRSESDKHVYIEPIKCRVKYRNLTSKGKLRIPSFVEWL